MTLSLLDHPALNLPWFDYIGYLGMLLGLVSMAMRTIIPLRLFALGACVCLGTFALFHNAWPTLVVNAVTIPVLAWRTREMLRLTRQVKAAAAGGLSLDALKPYMTARRIKAGEILMRRGEPATEMYCVASGRLRLVEYGATVGPGEFAGEIGMFSPERLRTATIVAETDVEYFVLDDTVLKQLYYQNPQFGFHLIELVTRRLVANLKQLQAAQAATR
ncbi:MAG: cyclic nucleotide-binding domain-containing protein [Rhodospirillaceae bacterium]|nr:cyclic nucleotide-binding domain-containing protein [Rhodospirillaceae bacterium]